jgi:hypothetical protein
MKIKALIHAFMMFVSAQYRKRVEVRKLLGELQDKVDACGYYRMHNGPAEVRRFICNDTNDFRHLVREIRRVDPDAFLRAIATLSKSDSVILLGLAVALSPEAGTACGDRLMGFARDNLRFVGHTDRAMWAKSELLLAREWYERAEALSHAREYEIEQHLTKLVWIG